MLPKFLLAILAGSAIASPTPLSTGNVTVATQQHELSSRAAGDFFLRIMPLGASITRGDPSAPGLDGRGYRKFLRDHLRVRGWKVNMVGSVRWGTNFNDNDNEGWPGYVVGPEDGTGNNAVHPKAKEFVPKYKPNLVLINCGTNDGNTDNDLPNIGRRMEAMIRTVFNGSPGTTVILSTLLPNRDNDARMEVINQQYRNLVPKLEGEGFKIQLADMHDGFITINDIFDGIHPTFDGAKKMASVWYKAIDSADRKGWLSAPSSDIDDNATSSTCEKSLDSEKSDPRSNVQLLCALSGNIYDDGTYVHKSEEQPEFPFQFPNLPVKDVAFRPRVYLAQLTTKGAGKGGERDEFVYIDGHSDKAFFRENNGDGSFGDIKEFKLPGFDCKTRGIRWGDVNNDGLDDFICITPNGDMNVGINEGGNPPVFRGVGLWKPAVPGYEQAAVRLGDIDGDGRLDYCVLNNGGDLTCWRSGGISRDKVDFWQDMGVVYTMSASGIANPGNDQMRLVDINGDNKADILYVNNFGTVTTFINQRGGDKSLKPFWRTAGVTHPGMGMDIGDPIVSIIFGRIYTDYHTDYVRWFLPANSQDPFYRTVPKAWKQIGTGGKFPKGDGAAWGDMTGSGNDDYVWISQQGDVVIFANKNKSPSTDLYKNCAAWDDKGVVLKTGMSRKALHVGDWNKDGKADIIGVNKADGSVTVWLTSYNDGKFSFSEQKSPQGYCDKGWGVGTTDLGLRFADVTGSGCVDALCLDPDGRTSAWLNDCNGMWGLRNVAQIKAAVTPFKDRANIRFADVNGDGKADYMWVDKFTGDTEVWYNDGEVSEGDRPGNLGSKIKWSGRGKTYTGSSRGQNMYFPDLGGVGRADMVEVNPQTAKGWVWFNSCGSGGGGGDDGGITPRDPELPLYGAMPQCSAHTCYGSRDDGISWACAPDPYADSEFEEDSCPDVQARDLSESSDFNSSLSSEVFPRELTKRGEPREFTIIWQRLQQRWELIVRARSYPGSSNLHGSSRGPPAFDWVFHMNPGCSNFGVGYYLRSTLTRTTLIDEYDTEHNPDLQFMRDFLWAAGMARLPNGNPTNSPGVSPADIERYWNQRGLMTGAPTLGGTVARCVTSPNDYLFDRFGSRGNRRAMVLCERDLNIMKGRVFNLRLPTGNPVSPMEQGRFDNLAQRSTYDSNARNALFNELRLIVGVFNYMREPRANQVIRANHQSLIDAADEISNRVNALSEMGRIMREFIPAWYQETAVLARAWLQARINDLRAVYDQAEQNGALNAADANILEDLVQALEDALAQIVSPV